jgi:hypothetical protein
MLSIYRLPVLLTQDGWIGVSEHVTDRLGGRLARRDKASDTLIAPAQVVTPRLMLRALICVTARPAAPSSLLNR